MPTLDVVSVNIWQILISLANLVIIFLIVKKFLFAPVGRMLAERQGEVDRQYAAADEAKAAAEADRDAWKTKMETARDEADEIIKKAVQTAEYRGDAIVAEAKERADGIVRAAETEARLEKEKARADIRGEIVDVSTVLAEKLLEREVNADDHRVLVDAFIDAMGDGNE